MGVANRTSKLTANPWQPGWPDAGNSGRAGRIRPSAEDYIRPFTRSRAFPASLVETAGEIEKCRFGGDLLQSHRQTASPVGMLGRGGGDVDRLAFVSNVVELNHGDG